MFDVGRNEGRFINRMRYDVMTRVRRVTITSW